MFGVQTQTQSGPSGNDDTALHGLRIICRDPCDTDYTGDETDYTTGVFETIPVYEDPDLAWSDPDVDVVLFSGAEA